MSKLRSWILAFSLFLTLVLPQQGCMESREETVKKILAHDSSFQNYLDKRNSLQKELDSQKISFLKKQQEIEGQINALKEEKVQTKEEYALSAEKTKRQIEPEKRRLKQDLLEMKRRHGVKRTELRGVQKDITEINSLIKKKDKLALTQEEMRTWNERLSSLIEKKAVIESEMDKFKKEIEITRLKIKVLDLD